MRFAQPGQVPGKGSAFRLAWLDKNRPLHGMEMATVISPDERILADFCCGGAVYAEQHDL